MTSRPRKKKPARAKVSPQHVVYALVALLIATAAAREVWRKTPPPPPPPPTAPVASAPAPRPAIWDVAVANDPAHSGTEQRLTIKTKPGAECDVGLSSIEGTIDDAPGLGPKRANFQGDVAWTWASEFPPFEAKEPLMMKLEIVCDGAKAEHLYTLLPP
ncbi:MAG: hypothetical protein KIT84_12900 [Labilithrix sp.]|nr:hypothetical protein [Labilithrix sp.]MCW5811913.1 hypothetical protein [Labilithrix sp.]